MGACCILVRPVVPDSLAPIGGDGEACLEGPRETDTGASKPMFLKSLPWVVVCLAWMWCFAWQSPLTYQNCAHVTVGVCVGWLTTLIGLSEGPKKWRREADDGGDA